MPIAVVRFIVFQAVWWVLVLSPRIDAQIGLPVSDALSLIVAFAAAFWIVRGNSQSRAHWTILLTALIGYLIDSFFVTYGVLQIPPETPLIEFGDFSMAPLWLLGLWMAFAAVTFSTVTLDFAKHFRTRKTTVVSLLVLALLGALGGPVSYAVGEPLGLLTIGPEKVLGLAILATEWMVMFPLILLLSLKAKKNGR